MATDYERYIRTDDLLRLQKEPAEMINHDELLFQVTHQASEVWMKAVLHDLSEAVRLMRIAAGEEAVAPLRPEAQSNAYAPLPRAVQLLRRSAWILGQVSEMVMVLEQMSPADYHQIRLALGRGSGQDSPGFNQILRMAQPVAEAYRLLFASRGAMPVTILGDPYGQGELHDLLQALLEVDEQLSRFRQQHMSLVRRQIGLGSLSLKGVPTEKLMEGLRSAMFPDLWEAVSELTNSTSTTY
jgi:tryptophan 2,3-dioxygenase